MAVHIGKYEAMFLLNAGYASGSWDAAKGEIEHILSRAGAEVLHLRKWDEKRLAYPISGSKRAAYVLAFFQCEGPKVAGIERDVQLSENILRVLITKADHLALKDVEAMMPQPPILDEPAPRAMRRAAAAARSSREPAAAEPAAAASEAV